MNINIKAFERQFQKEYNFLYENDDNVAGYKEAVAAFDEFLSENKNFVCEFFKYRAVFISSDREAAAFIFALSNWEV